ncbi:hypothetical protein IVA86_33185 [Bradyrhizobium sp. 146]|uniref:hypothetical protein n=1 Tax=Bradyrhizobium sp. 146 TaxID=2782622 RepID=UPI001FFB6AD9|nr:hypothetical protein [Bradyrhizobium sp. 146]MCK1706128.1 hypothetical protein [Bradyrhizobium sp. 146]
MNWSTLREALAMAQAGDIPNAQERVTRAVAEAGLVRPGALPRVVTAYALRVRVISSRTMVGMDWLQAPQLDFDKSEILCRSFMAGTQEQFEHPRPLHPALIELWAADVARLFPAAIDAGPHRRFSDDESLAREGAGGLDSGRWPNAHQAALELAKRADGNATFESKVRRIEGKISKILETSRNVSKD